jgi:NADPH:quinone reductase-like Zn-dependent oxidoreductase
MKAAIYTEYGPPEVLHIEDIEKPAPGPGELLVRVRATTVTTGDVNIRGFTFVPPGLTFAAKLMYGLKGPRKKVLGFEFAGEVAEVGEGVSSFAVGDRVFGIDGKGMGAYAEYKRVPEKDAVVPMPDGLSFEDAASIPNGALTALFFLREKAKVRKGQRVLVIGASGSVGSAAVQLARHFGARVTGVCSTANIELVRSLGASDVIDYREVDFTCSGEAWDIIVDTVMGGKSFRECSHSLVDGGIYLAVAGGLREMVQSLWAPAVSGKKLVTGGGLASEKKEYLEFIRDLVEAGDMKPVVDRTWPLEEVAEAHRYVDTGRKKGNVVIKVE